MDEPLAHQAYTVAVFERMIYSNDGINRKAMKWRKVNLVGDLQVICESKLVVVLV